MTGYSKLKVSLAAGMFGGIVVGCGPGFTPASLVDKVRVLAIQADPAEVQPGGSLTYRALVAAPDRAGESLVYTFVACTAGPEGCLEQSEALAAAGGDPTLGNELYQQTSVRYGFGNFQGEEIEAVGANLLTPASVLNYTPTPEEGANVQVTFIACMADACSEAGVEGGGTDLLSILDVLPPGESALAVKRARVSTSTSPNHNPVFTSLEIPQLQVEVPDGGAFTPATTEPLTLVAHLPDDVVEAYLYLTDDGVTESREERPYLRWYSTAGDFDASSTGLVENPEGGWTSTIVFNPPDPLEDFTVWAVIWDRRGGMAWISAHTKLNEEL